MTIKKVKVNEKHIQRNLTNSSSKHYRSNIETHQTSLIKISANLNIEIKIIDDSYQNPS